MSTTVTGTLGQLSTQRGELLGLIRTPERMLFVHVPADVVAAHAELLMSEATVRLTGHMCDHDTYLVVTGAAPANPAEGEP